MSSASSPGVVLSTLLETDHYESLIKDLTCTKCSKYMKPPIHLCVDGHSVFLRVNSLEGKAMTRPLIRIYHIGPTTKNFQAISNRECSWEGKAGEWMDHCFVEHKQKVTDLPFITVKDTWNAKRTEPVLNYFLLSNDDNTSRSDDGNRSTVL
ncbi:E3 ubiquitin-protein ligase [Operophtera brumata]|uniref:E3 ubiquitin-protein ligase n=1 Tax=Operophtera brumata TaxID=104452 RepID=A0A0L7KTQ2_OPEBR|nr:E3 ubiquitin-protein ligase [Operophtera brumata]